MISRGPDCAALKKEINGNPSYPLEIVYSIDTDVSPGIDFHKDILEKMNDDKT